MKTDRTYRTTLYILVFNKNYTRNYKIFRNKLLSLPAFCPHQKIYESASPDYQRDIGLGGIGGHPAACRPKTLHPPEERITLIEIDYNLSTTSEDTHAGIIDGLKAAGYSEGAEYELKRFNAQGDVATLSSILDVVESLKADVLFSISTPTTQAAIKKIKNTPVVFALVGDPVGIGAGTSFKDHLPNYTGICVMSDFEGAIAVLKQISPNLKRIGTLYCPAESNSVEYKNRLEAEATRNGIQLITKPINSTSDVPDALLALFADRIEILTQISDNLTNTCGETIMSMATDQHIPCFSFVSAHAKQGAFGALSRDYYQNGVDAAALAIRIINGESPQSIPFEMVSKTNLLFSQRMLDTYGIRLPDDIKSKATMIDN